MSLIVARFESTCGPIFSKHWRHSQANINNPSLEYCFHALRGSNSKGKHKGGKSNKSGADCKLKHCEAERGRTWFIAMESSFSFELLVQIANSYKIMTRSSNGIELLFRITGADCKLLQDYDKI
uniref:Uncharacterized protein n=1 Tax=Populus alba TaxID=43335 RepID=A0A4U5QMM1_POPAL|nr:hypothetical protein D5086_0000081830 [Populus alba]